MQSSKKWLASGMTACSMTMPFCVFSFSISAMNLFQRRDAVLVAMDEQARRGAGGEKAKIEAVGGWGDRDEALNLRSAHQELHADPGAERDASDPAGARLRADRLRPVESGGGVRQFALTMVEGALRPSDAAEVEAQHRKPAFGEIVVSVVDNLIVHRPAKLRDENEAPPRSAPRAAWRGENGPPADRRDR